jgi:putative ABC transport system permease protein
MRQDFLYALRNLRKSRSFTVLAVAALAIGIGANTAIFSVVDTVLLRPLPYKDADRLVMLWAHDPRQSEGIMPVTPADFADWREQSHSFSQLAASSDAVYNLTGAGDPEMLLGYSFDAKMFPLLGAEPALGRVFRADDGPQVVVLSHSLWKRRFGGDPNIVGRGITLDQKTYTVVGVMPAEFNHPGAGTALWTPLVIPPELVHSRDQTFLRIVGRLAPGVSFEQARTELRGIAGRLATAYPETNTHRSAELNTLRDLHVAGIRPTLLLLLGAVGFVLVLVCNNVASLLLARAQGRQREMAIRAALGASRRRIVRQLLTESLILSVLAGAVGLLLALWTVGGLVRLFPQSIGNLHMPRIDHIPIDGRVIAFTVLVSLVTCVLFGLTPALAAARPDLERALRESSPGASPRSSRLRRLLVTGEIAIALTLAVGAGLLARSFECVAAKPLGFAPHGVLTARAVLSDTRYPKPEQRRRFVDGVLARVRALPGVRAAAVSTLPLSRWWSNTEFTVEGRTEQLNAAFNVVDPGYFGAMKIPLLRGRNFDSGDRDDRPSVCVVDQTFADRYFPGEDPIGRRLNHGTAAKPEWRTIVGVVGDISQFGPEEEPRPTLYVPFSQKAWPLLGFVLRGPGEPAQLVGPLREAVGAVDADQPLSYVMTLDDLVSDTLITRRVTLYVLLTFAGVGLLLAALGVYGVMAFMVAERRREIGIRVALGADRRDVARLVLGNALRVAVAGVAMGLVIALLLGRLMASLLYQVGASDPLTFTGTAIVMTAVALLAAWLPMRAATRTDPMVALRSD